MATNKIKKVEAEAQRLKAEAEAEAQKLKAEAEAEKEKLEQEKQLLETEKQKLEEDKQKLEKEKSELEAEKKSAEEAKAKKEAEEKAVAEAEEKRLLALRIKKVEGTDSYTCIDGWTNFVRLCETRKGKDVECTTGSIMPANLMDSNGVIRDYSNATGGSVAADYILKDLKGCFVKSTEILTFQGMKTYDGSKNYWDEERVLFYDKDNESHTSTFAEILKMRMDEKDVTNDPRTGWTDEERTKWGGYKPVMGMYYFVTMNRDKIDTAYYAGYGKNEKIRMAGETARDFYDKMSGYTRGKRAGDAFK